MLGIARGPATLDLLAERGRSDLLLRRPQGDLGERPRRERLARLRALRGPPRTTPRRAAVNSPSALGGSPEAAAARSARFYTPDRLAERMLAAGRTLEGERKVVTVLFADVVGSMELAERLGPENWRRVMDRSLAILCEGVHRFEGMVDQFTGDGLMALFGAPLAQEDHAARACNAALRLLEQLAGFSAELRSERGLGFAVRVGMNSGEVVTGAIGDDLTLQYAAVGHTVGLARRVESLAAPNTAFVSHHTAALVEGYFELRDRGMRQLKGVRKPVRVYELAGLGRLRSHLEVSRARGLARFVGRERELAALRSALGRAGEGAGQVVGVVGEAGIGKSRLCYEFSELCRKSGIQVWAGQCTARGARQPLLLVRELAGSIFGVTDWDTERAVRDKVAGRALVLDPPIEDELPLILELLGVSGDGSSAGSGQHGEQLFATLRRLLLGGSGAGPRVIVVEELRWIDPPSEAFLKALVKALPATPTLLVASFRPEYRARWLHSFNYTPLPLQPLDERSLAALLRDQLGSDPSLAALAERIPDRVGGNPFFFEELVRDLLERGGLEGERGAFRAVAPIDETALPATVHAVLTARIDRLSERDKTVLQAAAVIGHQITEPLLKQVTRLDDKELHAALRALVRADLLVWSTTTAEGYAFKHHLTQEVAYRSELSERRARIHGAVAHALEEQQPDKRDELAALIAHHLEEAGESARPPTGTPGDKPQPRWGGR
ncbi:MAG TPA: adenylate/guanylate cyclase domain-containing protein [Thermoleophilaceae bacterium]|nr:adenylate/guanylate cyclase domain-containing protein [Thermoleophilaceae bacterium]